MSEFVRYLVTDIAVVSCRFRVEITGTSTNRHQLSEPVKLTKAITCDDSGD